MAGDLRCQAAKQLAEETGYRADFEQLGGPGSAYKEVILEGVPLKDLTFGAPLQGARNLLKMFWVRVW